MIAEPLLNVTLYTRQGCHLCDETKADLESLQAVIPHKLTLVDVESDDKLLKTYGLEVPVVEVGPFRLKAPITPQDLQVMLSAARDRVRDIQRVENSPALAEARLSVPWTRSDGINLFLSRHYMLVFNILVFIYLGMSFLAPVLAKERALAPAGLLYKAYGFVCHQLGFRSFYLFGEQPFYPRAAAHVAGYQTFQQATGLGESGSVEDILGARAFIGDDTVGYKVALCERDVAIYGGILLFGLLFAATGFRLKALPWWVWLLIAIAPIGLDGFSQLLSQPPLNLFPFRESTPTLRVLTGFLFGFFTAWFGYPLVEESMIDTRKLMQAKWDRLRSAVH